MTAHDGTTGADRAWDVLHRVRFAVSRPFARARHAWRSSLHLRVVLTTLSLSLVVLLVLSQFLLGRVTDGLLAAKERSALDEARAGLAQAQLLADAAERGGDPLSNVALVDGVARQLANRAGNPSIYEVLLLGVAGQRPRRRARVRLQPGVGGQRARHLCATPYGRPSASPRRTPRSSTPTGARPSRGSPSARRWSCRAWAPTSSTTCSRSARRPTPSPSSSAPSPSRGSPWCSCSAGSPGW